MRTGLFALLLAAAAAAAHAADALPTRPTLTLAAARRVADAAEQAARTHGAFEDIVRNGRTAMLNAPHLVPLVGGVPLVAGRQVVGGIGVAGAASPQDDEAIAKAGAAALE